MPRKLNKKQFVKYFKNVYRKVCKKNKRYQKKRCSCFAFLSVITLADILANSPRKLRDVS